MLIAIHQSDKATLQQKFPLLFMGLRSIQNKYSIYDIKLRPYANLYTARHMPIPLCDRVKAELKLKDFSKKLINLHAVMHHSVQVW